MFCGVLLFLAIMAGSQKSACGKALEFYNEQIDVRVIEKYIDYENHANLVLKVESGLKINELRFIKGNRESIIYQKATVGDSILKRPMSSFVTIKDSSQTKMERNVFFYRCDSIKIAEKI
jgi:hypothetical protein